MEIQQATLNNQTRSKEEGMTAAREMQQCKSHFLSAISSHMDEDNESAMLTKHK